MSNSKYATSDTNHEASINQRNRQCALCSLEPVACLRNTKTLENQGDNLETGARGSKSENSDCFKHKNKDRCLRCTESIYKSSQNGASAKMNAGVEKTSESFGGRRVGNMFSEADKDSFSDLYDTESETSVSSNEKEVSEQSAVNKNDEQSDLTTINDSVESSSRYVTRHSGLSPGAHDLKISDNIPSSKAREKVKKIPHMKVTLEKPFGIVLEEGEVEGAGGAYVVGIATDGSAASSLSYLAGDLVGLKLSKVQEDDASQLEFDDVLQKIEKAPPTVSLEFVASHGRSFSEVRTDQRNEKSMAEESINSAHEGELGDAPEESAEMENFEPQSESGDTSDGDDCTDRRHSLSLKLEVEVTHGKIIEYIPLPKYSPAKKIEATMEKSDVSDHERCANTIVKVENEGNSGCPSIEVTICGSKKSRESDLCSTASGSEGESTVNEHISPSARKQADCDTHQSNYFHAGCAQEGGGLGFCRATASTVHRKILEIEEKQSKMKKNVNARLELSNTKSAVTKALKSNRTTSAWKRCVKVTQSCKASVKNSGEASQSNDGDVSKVGHHATTDFFSSNKVTSDLDSVVSGSSAIHIGTEDNENKENPGEGVSRDSGSTSSAAQGIRSKIRRILRLLRVLDIRSILKFFRKCKRLNSEDAAVSTVNVHEQLPTTAHRDDVSASEEKSAEQTNESEAEQDVVEAFSGTFQSSFTFTNDSCSLDSLDSVFEEEHKNRHVEVTQIAYDKV